MFISCQCDSLTVVLLSSDQRKRALEPLLAQLPGDILEWYYKSRPAMETWQNDTFGDNAIRSQWYLQRIGVLPNRQGEGIGTKLINTVRDKVGLLIFSCYCKSSESHILS